MKKIILYEARPSLVALLAQSTGLQHLELNYCDYNTFLKPQTLEVTFRAITDVVNACTSLCTVIFTTESYPDVCLPVNLCWDVPSLTELNVVILPRLCRAFGLKKVSVQLISPWSLVHLLEDAPMLETVKLVGDGAGEEIEEDDSIQVLAHYLQVKPRLLVLDLELAPIQSYFLLIIAQCYCLNTLRLDIEFPSW